MRQAVERYTGIPVLGALPRDGGFAIEERHLGLMTPMETPASRAAIERLRQAIESGVDLDSLLEIARNAPPLPASPAAPSTLARQDVRIAIARDSAFGFYYPGDLEAFERAGAELCFFDALSDARLPGADGLFIGGGFPETQAAQLEANASLRADIAQKIRAGLPAYAECGGMMYLARSIRWGNASHETAGVIPADAVMHTRPQGRGLAVLEETADALWPAAPAMAIPAHEFHYASLENLDPSLRFAYKVARGDRRRRAARRHRARQPSGEFLPFAGDRREPLGGSLRALRPRPARQSHASRVRLTHVVRTRGQQDYRQAFSACRSGYPRYSQ